MSSVFKSIRIGTAVSPNIVKNVCAQFPSRSVLPLIDPLQVVRDNRPFSSLKAMGTRHKNARPTKLMGYPSISTVISATDNLEKLYQWQLRMIHQLGTYGFNTFMVKRMGSGRAFHKATEDLLKELMEHGEIMSTAEEVVMRRSPDYKDELVGYLSGIRDFLCTLKANPLTRLETSTYNLDLCYNGRFDALVEMDGELTLVDWKTVNAQSTKSQSSGEKLASDLYSNPVQIAAYVAAVNSDPAFKDFPQIQRAAVVLAYEDGRGVEVVHMGKDDIEQYYDEFCIRVNKFWWLIENGPMRGEYVDFVYNPVTAAPKSDANNNVEPKEASSVQN